MKNQPLTAFQQNAENEITDLLRHAGRQIEVREVLEGVVPFVSKEPQTVVKLDAGDLSI